VNPTRLIERKREGLALDPADLRAFLQGYLEGGVPDYQVSALLMAIVFQGLSPDETAVLVETMVASGATLDLDYLDLPRVDKHSTGGVGDKVSLVLAPLAAELGMYVPMMSGRGLGHTTGTLDKLEAIPGFRVDLPLERFKAVLQSVGCAMTGQTDEIAPLDRRLYALRDVTGTVPSIPLIAASIMSKKLAEGLDGLVLDVKVGDGAFLPGCGQGARVGADDGAHRRRPWTPHRGGPDRHGPSARGRGGQRARDRRGDTVPRWRRAGRPPVRWCSSWRPRWRWPPTRAPTVTTLPAGRRGRYRRGGRSTDSSVWWTLKEGT
jgi:hypothetical protein